jgi:hypothetical protein
VRTEGCPRRLTEESTGKSPSSRYLSHLLPIPALLTACDGLSLGDKGTFLRSFEFLFSEDPVQVGATLETRLVIGGDLQARRHFLCQRC